MTGGTASGSMNRSESQALRRLITDGRLRTFRELVPRGTDIGAVRLYLWNVDVSAAMWLDMAMLEVLFRNTIDSRLRTSFGRDHWYLTAAGAFSPDLADKSIAGLNQAHRWLGTGTPLAQHPAGKVVAELTFGFWVNLVSAGGPRGGQNGQFKNYNNLMWLPAAQPVGSGVRHGFPGLVQPSSKAVFRHASLLAEVRNRIAHHEPILQGVRRKGSPTTDPLVPLNEVHAALVELVGWIDPVLVPVVERNSTFQAAWSRRPF